MGVQFSRRTLLLGGAATSVGIAGASAMGLGLSGTAGATTNGPGRNGISKAKPKKGGTLVFGTDAEESGFNPTTARFDEVGVMYAHTVFDPLTAPSASGGSPPTCAPRRCWRRRTRGRPAMAINRPQYAKEIDENVLPVSDGLFTPGSPYYSSTSYPAHNPSEAKKLVQAALELGRTSETSSGRATAYQTVNKRLAIDLPYLWLDRAVWSVESTLKVQNWNNPTTPSGSKAYGMIGGSIWPTQIWLS